MYLRNLILGILLIGSGMCAQPPKPFIHSPWSKEFHLRESDNGDIISIGAMHAAGDTLYVYDMASGRIVAFDRRGAIVSRTKISPLGRGTYLGDDFVVRRGKALFLNTVDKKIDMFDLRTGAHRRSILYPLDALDNEPRRTRRVINRIFLEQDRIILGNVWHYFYLDETLGKNAASYAINSVTAGQRLQNMHEGAEVVIANGSLYVRGALKGDTVGTHYPIAGKQYVMFNGALYSLSLTEKEMRVVAVR
jgi:hypothetical protein